MEDTRNSTGKDGIYGRECVAIPATIITYYRSSMVVLCCIEHCFAEFPLGYAPPSKLFSGPPVAFLSHRPGRTALRTMLGSQR